MTITQSSSRFVAVVGGAVVAFGLLFGAIAAPVHASALTPSQVSAIVSLLQSFGADAGTIANVQASLTGGTVTTTTGSSTTTGGSCSTTFNNDLTIGSTGSDVMALQKFLNMSASTMIASSGAGSPGMETSTFGPLTQAAVIKFQTQNNIAPAAGYVGPLTRAKLNSLCTSSTTTTTTTTTGGTTTTTTGTGTATVSAAAQPANGIAPYNAARIPFTKFTVSASGGDVTLNSVTVERDGIASDAAFSGVMLLDQNGNEIGITKTLNSNHQAVIGAPVVIPNGTTMTFTVAANRPSSDSSTYAGQIATFSVVAVNTNAAVTNGALPITGASQTINETSNLIGSLTVNRGPSEPSYNSQLNVGTTQYIFSSVQLTAGSSEDDWLKSIRFHQVGSASQSYLANVVVVINGTSYPTTVSADNYYTATLPGTGIDIPKGNTLNVAIQGDVVNGSNTTVEFDIEKASDINVVGGTYGYGINPTYPTVSGSCVANGSRGTVQNSDDPYFCADTALIAAGTVTVSTSNAISSQNIAFNQNNQPLAAIAVQDQGESVSVGKMVFHLMAGISSISSGALIATTTLPTGAVTSVSLVDQNGNVLAGPVDADTSGNVTFTDTVTFPVGTTNVTLEGKVNSGLTNGYVSGETIGAQTNPGGGDWSSAVGQTTGRTITFNNGEVGGSLAMTLQSAALTVSASSVPIAQTVIAGSSQFTFANYVINAGSSGEDVRISTLPVLYATTGSATDLLNCQLYNGSTSVTTGGHVINPSAVGTQTFTFDNNGITVPKGTSVTLALECDVRSGLTSGTYTWGITSPNTSYTGASGATSGQTVSTVFSSTNSAGQTMSVSTGGTLTATLDSSTPSFGVVSAGSTGIDLGHINFAATNEAVNLRQVALQLTSGHNYDLVGNQVTLWDASTNTQVGTATFSTGANATSSLIANGTFTIPANGNRILIIKGSIAAISVNGPITASGDTLKVDYDGNNNGVNGNYGVGVSSGQTRTPASVDTAVKGVTIYRSFPTFTYGTTGGTAFSGNQALLTLTVGADSQGDVTLNKLTFGVSTTTATINNLTFTGPNGSVGSVGSAYGTNDGVINSGTGNVIVDFNSVTNTGDAIVPKGTTKTYTLRGTLTLNGTNSTGSISVQLKADAHLPQITLNGNGLATSTDSSLTSSFMIWSPESTSSVLTPLTNNDWTNGYGLGGCFATSGLGSDCFSNVLSH